MVTKETPLVTFAIFAYNQERFIREAVEAAFSQNYRNMEIILSDDCSTDSTYDIMTSMAAEYKGPHTVRCRRSATNRRLAGHINDVMELAAGEFVCIAAGDDVSLPTRVRLLVEPMLADAEVFGTHSNVVEIDDQGRVLGARSIPDEIRNVSLEGVLTRGAGVVAQSHMLRKSGFEKFGSMDEALTNEGPVMAFRELNAGKVIFVEEPTVHYRVGVGVSTKQPSSIYEKQIEEAIKVTMWGLTSVNQMIKDCEKLSDAGDVYNVLKKERRFHSNLLDVNTGASGLGGVARNIMLRPTDRRTLRAYIRRRLPPSLYGAVHGWRG